MKMGRTISVLKRFLLVLTWILLASDRASACTSVCLFSDGRVVFGNNLDWFVSDGAVFINKRNVKKRGIWFNNPPQWVSKYASVTANQEGREFPARGMNEAGLVVGEMWLGETEYPDPDSRFVLNTTQWIQYQLDNCADIREVIDTDKIVRIDKNEYPSHFFVCDSSGDCAALEWIGGKLQAHAYDEAPVRVMANSPYGVCVKKGNDPSGRFGKAAAMLKNFSSGDPVDRVFSILREVSQNSTQWSLVFDSKNRRLHYRTAKNGEIRSVSLLDFDLSCSSAVRLIDINGPGSGNVFDRFVPFTEELNADLVRGTYRQLEPRFGPFSEEMIERIAKYPSTTECIKN
jgi:choloylglycine hydrolase